MSIEILQREIAADGTHLAILRRRHLGGQTCTYYVVELPAYTRRVTTIPRDGGHTLLSCPWESQEGTRYAARQLLGKWLGQLKRRAQHARRTATARATRQLPADLVALGQADALELAT